MASFYKLHLCICVSNKTFAVFRRFLPVLPSVNWTQATLFRVNSAVKLHTSFPRRSRPKGYYIWLGLLQAMKVRVDVVRHARKRIATSLVEQSQLKTDSPSFVTTTEPLAKTAAAAHYHVFDLIPNQWDSENVKGSSPSSKRTRLSDNRPGSNHSPHTSSCCWTNYNASTTASAPPYIQVKKSDV